MEKVRLPVVQGEMFAGPAPELESSLLADGSRKLIHPADVRGRFLTARRLVFAVLIAFWAIVPFLRVDGRPFLMLDVEHRRFFIFGGVFGAQDAWRLWFILTGVGLALVITTSLFGRVWCGWTCPHTVFLEAFFRPIERLVEGPREVRVRVDTGEWTTSKTMRKVVKHTIFVVLAALVAHVFVGYFVSPYRLWAMIFAGPGKHPEAFAWAIGLTGIFYGNFGFFREQTCVGVCPYGRLQSVLVDQDTVVVGYERPRGEPRAKASEKAKNEDLGDCVDCKRCVVVCPMGIDIRNGLQPDCIGCAQCSDACDEIMDKLHRPRGLVRYDTTRALDGGKRQIWRPRAYLYVAVTVVWVVAAFFLLRGRVAFEANILRVGATPFVIDGDSVRNAFNVHVVNKGSDPVTFELEAKGEGVSFVVPIKRSELPAFGGVDVPIIATVPRSATARPIPITVDVRGGDGSLRTVSAVLLGPGPFGPGPSGSAPFRSAPPGPGGVK
ncbi:MAG: cytochrome c oxidase accessory protein CcoG [Deltaproteobacteria bacterium]|nr:cytochrome c oxidase accessory protein CcoG [Deltaproteobacteria bacterium]